MSYPESYEVTLVIPISPTQISLSVRPKPRTPRHTPVSSILLRKTNDKALNCKGKEHGNGSATVTLTEGTFIEAGGITVSSFVSYLSDPVVGTTVEDIHGFDF